MGFDVDRYLEKLSLKREKPTVSFLKRIHKNHVFCIPYENLDLYYQRRIVLDIDLIFDKIIPTKRGGMAFELNGLLYHLLKNLGYDCGLISAQFGNQEDGFGRELEHMVVSVHCEGRNYLADVGKAEQLWEPKLIERGKVYLDNTKYYRFSTNPDSEWLLQKSHDSMNFQTLYKLNEGEKKFIQFLEICDYLQDNEKSYLKKEKFANKLTQSGKIELTEKGLTIVENGERKEENIFNEDSFLAKLEQFFGIKLQDLVEQI